jgi:hypothetical protein
LILLTAALALALSLTACGKEDVVIAPEFSGRLVVDDKPGAGAEVLVGFSGDHDQPCDGLPVAAVADATGYFRAKAQTVSMSKSEKRAVPYGTFQNYVCFRYKGELFVSSLFITDPQEKDRYIGSCIAPHTSTGYDDRMCQWRREHA